MPKKPRLGNLPPRYLFALNPHTEYRASTCPNCDRLTYPRKFALLIHADFKGYREIEYFPGGWYPKDFVPPIPPRRRKSTKRRKE